MRSQNVILAAVVVILCVMGTLTAYGIGSSLDDDATYPDYVITGTDGTAFSGTASCRELERSGGQVVLGVSYAIVKSDGTSIELTSHLITDDDGPVEIYENMGESTTLGEHVTLWRTPDGGFTYHLSDDGTVLAIDISADGISAIATAVHS